MFFKIDIYVVFWFGLIGVVIVLIVGMMYLELRWKKVQIFGEGYGGFDLENIVVFELFEFMVELDKSLVQYVFVFVLFIFVGVVNKCFIIYFLKWYLNGFDFLLIGLKEFGKFDIFLVVVIWLVEFVLVIGIIIMILFDWRRVFV